MEWLGHFLTANGIDEDGRKRAVLLTMIGAKAYKLLRKLVSPEKPGDKTYNELLDAMQPHHSPKPSAIVQCHRYNCHFRWEGESEAQYLSELSALSEICNSGQSLDEITHHVTGSRSRRRSMVNCLSIKCNQGQPPIHPPGLLLCQHSERYWCGGVDHMASKCGHKDTKLWEVGTSCQDVGARKRGIPGSNAPEFGEAHRTV